MELGKLVAPVLRLFAALSFIATIAIGASMFLFPGISSASGSIGDVGTWQTSTSLPFTSVFDEATATYNNYAYVIGGAINGASFSSAVYYAPLNSDGAVGAWQTATNSLPVSLNNESAIAYNGYLYIIGGDSASGLLASVYYAPLNSDGSVGSWQTSTNNLPDSVANGATAVNDGYVYLIGGDNSGGLTSVYYAKLNSNGSVGSWQISTNSVPSARDYARAVIDFVAGEQSYIYVIGGTTSAPLIYARLSADGSVESWQTASNSPTFNTYQDAVEVNGYLYVYGGGTGVGFPPSGVATIQSAKINGDGSVGSWTTSPNSIINTASQPVGFSANGYIYQLGGGNFGQGNDAEYAPLYYNDQLTINADVAIQPSAIVTVPQGDNVNCGGYSTSDVQDTGYTYPLGYLVSFCFTTQDQVPTNQVSITFVSNLSPTQLVPRYFDETTQRYMTVPNATITETTLNGNQALKLTYTITDGGALDDDGLANGQINDPVGLAEAVSTSSITAPNTGYGQPRSNGFEYLFALSSLSLGFGIRFLHKSKSRSN